MSTIVIDLSDYMGLNIPAIHSTIVDVTASLATSARTHWIKLADTGLRTTRSDYIRAIRELKKVGTSEWVVALDHPDANRAALPAMIEEGWEGGDMRDWMIPNGGEYANVMFRWMSPVSEREAADRKGRVARHFQTTDYPSTRGDIRAAKRVGARVWEATTRLKGAYATVGSQKLGKYGQRVNAVRVGVALPKLHAHNVMDPYSGMVRLQGAYSTGNDPRQAKRVTWRRISNRKKSGWIHPGITARHFAEATADYVGQIAPAAIKAAFGGTP